jgi:hypothetical protein
VEGSLEKLRFGFVADFGRDHGGFLLLTRAYLLVGMLSSNFYSEGMAKGNLVVGSRGMFEAVPSAAGSPGGSC